jgi:hypothetical protein
MCRHHLHLDQVHSNRLVVANMLKERCKGDFSFAPLTLVALVKIVDPSSWSCFFR